ncbi:MULTISPECIES: hypothetical protein [Streptomyces]|uniref:hypothetical protein n=1 Tax=Streptomyces TaxID=1883 RepID=UPI001E51C5D6|nr:hypothetical protein [Streptomyces spirodelae]
MADPKQSELDALYEDANAGVMEARQRVRDAAAGKDSARLDTALDELEAALAHREAARLRTREDAWILTALGAANAIDPEFHGGDPTQASDADDADDDTPLAS